MLHLRQTVLDAVILARHVEHVGHELGGRVIGVAGREGDAEVRPVLLTNWTTVNLLVRSMAT